TSGRLQFEAKVVSESVDRDQASTPHVVDARRARTGEKRSAVVATEQRGREVQHVAIDETGAMEGCGNGRAALDHRLHDSLSPELVEHAIEVALELERGMHPRMLRSVAEHHAQRVAAFDMANRERRIVG